MRRARGYVFAVSVAAVGCLVAACGGGNVASGSSGGKTVVLQFADSGTATQPEVLAAQRAADDVKKYTNGTVQIKVYPNGSLFKQDTAYQALLRGDLDMTYEGPETLAANVPQVSVLAVPYLYRSYDQIQQVVDGDVGTQLFGILDSKLKVHALGVQFLGPRDLNLRTTRHINTPTDMAGLRLRMPGGPFWTKVGQSLGGRVTPVAFDELYLALQTGTVDAQDNPPITDVQAKFAEVTKQLVLTEHLYDTLLPLISDKAWNKLSASQRSALQRAWQDADAYGTQMVKDNTAQAIQTMRNDGLAVYAPDLQAFRTRALNTFLNDQSFTSTLAPGMLQSVEQVTGVSAG